MIPDAQCDAQTESKRLTDAFFRAVSFEPGRAPNYALIHDLFIERGLLIKNVGPSPEVSGPAEFIQPRQVLVDSGRLTRFHETEIAGRTTVFGNVAHRLSIYSKAGTQDGNSFATRGVISTQFILTALGWKISSMAWDDERAGLSIPASLFGGDG